MSAESLAFVMLGRTVTTEDCSGEPGDFAALIRFQPAGYLFIYLFIYLFMNHCRGQHNNAHAFCTQTKAIFFTPVLL